MINNRIRTIVSTAAGSTLVASVLGLAALGFSSVANANASPAISSAPNAAHFNNASLHPRHGCYKDYCKPGCCN